MEIDKPISKGWICRIHDKDVLETLENVKDECKDVKFIKDGGVNLDTWRVICRFVNEVDETWVVKKLPHAVVHGRIHASEEEMKLELQRTVFPKTATPMSKSRFWSVLLPKNVFLEKIEDVKPVCSRISFDEPVLPLVKVNIEFQFAVDAAWIETNIPSVQVNGLNNYGIGPKFGYFELGNVSL